MPATKKEKWILYSTCDEDSYSELRALTIDPTDSVISVTGSGCRTLSLLSRNPRSVVSVDFSPGQSYLLELKLTAIRSLSYDRLLAFFGVDPCDQRWDIFESLSPRLSPRAAAYFRSHRPSIMRGVLFSGRHELFYIRFVAPLMNLLYGRAFAKIFRCSTLEEQRKIYRQEIDGKVWRSLIRNGFSERMLKLVLNDKNYRIEVDVDSVGGYVLERVEHTFTNHLARNNHWINMMLTGKYPSRTCLPHFLLEDSYHAIRKARTDVKIVTDNLCEYLKRLPARSVDKFSLSDVTSCIDREQFNALLTEVARTAKPGGRVCYRNFLAKYPVSWNSRMQRDDAVCSSLDRDDLAFVYSFEVASVAAAAAA